MGTTKDKYWYWSLVAPNVKGPGFAWLDPSRLYANREAFRDCVIDLLEPFDTNEIDLVAGIDAMGFILGSSIANYLDKGFLALRKKGGLCVDTSDVHYTDYQNTKKTLEIRTDPFLEGTRVLLVDQWIETGGTMHAAITLVERMKGIVAGVCALAIEFNTHEKAKKICENYKCSHVVPKQLQEQIDNHYLETFKKFEEGKAGFAFQP